MSANPPAQAAMAEFDASLVGHILRLPKRHLLRVVEVAEILDVSIMQVRELIDAGDLEAHDMTRLKAKAPLGLFGERLEAKGRLAGRQRRYNTRVTRRSVVLYLARSAEYDLNAEECVAAIGQILRDLPNRALEVVRAECSKHLATRALHQ